MSKTKSSKHLKQKPPVWGTKKRFFGQIPLFKKQQNRLSRPLTLFLVLGFLGISIGYAAMFFGQRYLFPLTEKILTQTGFRLEYVLVENRVRTNPQEILQATQVKIGQGIFTFCPLGLKHRLEKLPWVDQAIVERRLPNTLFIRLIEKQPLALWQYQGIIKLIDTKGKCIHCSKQAFPKGLLQIVGEKANEQGPDFLKVLEGFPKIKEAILAAVFLRTGRWNLHLKNGWEVKLPEKNLEKALTYLLQFEHKHPFCDSAIAALDLRFKETCVVKFKKEFLKANIKNKLPLKKDPREV